VRVNFNYFMSDPVREITIIEAVRASPATLATATRLRFDPRSRAVAAPLGPVNRRYGDPGGVRRRRCDDVSPFDDRAPESELATYLD